MKYLAVFILLQFLLLGNDLSQAQWLQYAGLADKTVRSIAVSRNNIFTGTTEGFFVSTNNGINWTELNTSINTPIDLPDSHVNAITVSGTNIFAGFDRIAIFGGVILSTDNGKNWKQVGNVVYGVSSISVIGNNIFAGTDRKSVV